MSAFLDASAIVAILSHEPDSEALIARIEAAGATLYFSSMAVFEATFGLARKKAPPGRRTPPAVIADARSTVEAFLKAIGAEEVAISSAVADMAVDAGERFGEAVGHPANLNMGDCFAYACAKSKGVPLLYKGDDFSKTDIATL